MPLERNKRILIGLLLLFSISTVAVGQTKSKMGWVFGEVGIVDPAKPVTDRLPFAKIELKYGAKIFTIDANDGAIIDEQLPVGRYRLLRVFDKDGNEMEFVDFQEFEFVVKSKKRVRFYIHLKPGKKAEEPTRVSAWHPET